VTVRRSRLFPELANQRWTLWAFNEKVGKWLALDSGLRHQRAIGEMVERQNRVRKSGHPCVFKLLPDGQTPDEGAASV